MRTPEHCGCTHRSPHTWASSTKMCPGRFEHLIQTTKENPMSDASVPVTPSTDPAGPPPDPNTVFCPRAPSWTSPCVARDGRVSAPHDSCVTCHQDPAELLKEIVPMWVHVVSGIQRLLAEMPKS